MVALRSAENFLGRFFFWGGGAMVALRSAENFLRRFFGEGAAMVHVIAPAILAF